MGTYDRILGALLLASWFNCCLFTIEGLQMYQYWTRFRLDSWFNKTCVSIALCADIGGMVATTSMCYLYTVTHFGDEVYALSQPWSFILYGLSSGVCGFTCQTFLSMRIYRLTGQIAYPIFFGLVSSASLGGIIASAVKITSGTSYADRIKISHMIYLWLSAAAAVDILIASALVFILSRAETSFKATEGLLRRLMIHSVTTGSMTAGTAVIALAVFAVYPNDNVCVFFSLSLGRLYTLTMLSNLNRRGTEWPSEPDPTSGQTPREYLTGTRNMIGAEAGLNEMSLRGVKVTSESITQTEESEAAAAAAAVDEEEDDRRRALRCRPVTNSLELSTMHSDTSPSSTAFSSSHHGGRDPSSSTSSNHKDEWDDPSLPNERKPNSSFDLDLEHSQVDLVTALGGSEPERRKEGWRS
ncbi:hypothetical protein BDY24DRAFT_416217 [Mrakia frigida]|uniref:DUF6534 domain-containing protein n=1 Tax=Mrakia frigida TaxID=29902 RepID=UPI003FCBEE4F